MQYCNADTSCAISDRGLFRCNRHYGHIAFNVLDGLSCQHNNINCCQTLLYCEVIDGKFDKNRCGKCHVKMIDESYHAYMNAYDYTYLVTCEYNGIVVSFKYSNLLSTIHNTIESRYYV